MAASLVGDGWPASVVHNQSFYGLWALKRLLLPAFCASLSHRDIVASRQAYGLSEDLNICQDVRMTTLMALNVEDISFLHWNCV